MQTDRRGVPGVSRLPSVISVSSTRDHDYCVVFVPFFREHSYLVGCILLVFRSANGAVFLVPDIRDLGSDPFPRDHDLFGEINMPGLKGAASVDLGDRQISDRRVLVFPSQASQVGFVNLKILDLVTGLHFKTGHRVTASSGAHALEEVNKVVAFNDAAGLAVSGDAVNNIGLNADSGITYPAILGSDLEVLGNKNTHDGTGEVGSHLQIGRQVVNAEFEANSSDLQGSAPRSEHGSRPKESKWVLVHVNGGNETPMENMVRRKSRSAPRMRSAIGTADSIMESVPVDEKKGLFFVTQMQVQVKFLGMLFRVASPNVPKPTEV